MEIQPGKAVYVRTALGETLPRIAVSGIVQGGSFPIVWVCREDESRAAINEGREPDRVPWPAEDVWARQVSGGSVS